MFEGEPTSDGLSSRHRRVSHRTSRIWGIFAKIKIGPLRAKAYPSLFHSFRSRVTLWYCRPISAQNLDLT